MIQQIKSAQCRIYMLEKNKIGMLSEILQWVQDMREKYLIITEVKLLISQWHVNSLVGILRKPTFNLQLTQSSTLITVLPIYYPLCYYPDKRQKKKDLL